MDDGISTERWSDRLVLDAAGVKLAVARSGSGPAIICLHAIGHGARDFARLPGELGGRYQIIAVDWPGHGASPPESAPPGARRYAELLEAAAEALATQLGISSFYILGNSVGGAAAMLFAAARPNRVRGLILCNPAGLQPVNFIARFVCRRMAAFFARGVRGDARFAARFRRYYEHEVLPAAAAAWRREEIITTGEQMASILQQAWTGFSAPDADLRHLAPNIACPVLLAWTKADRYIAWRRSKRAALTFPNRQVRLFEGGHSAFIEDPAAFAAALKQFVASSAAETEATPKISAKAVAR